MRFSLVTAPTSEPVSIADVETQSNTGDLPADQNGRVTAMIQAARAMCETRNKRQFITATWIGYLDGFPAEIEIRDKLPVTAISSVKYFDTNIVLQTLSSDNYTTDFASQNAPARIMPAAGYSWPSTSSDVYNAVQVTFTAGYGDAGDVPDQVKHAILMLVGQWYENREVAAPVELKDVPFGFDELLAANDWGWYG